MFRQHKSDEPNPWRKASFVSTGRQGYFELMPGKNCGHERFRDFDLWIGTEGAATVCFCGHKIEIEKDRMILIPPGVWVRLTGKADQGFKMFYTHFDCIISGRPVRDVRTAINKRDLTMKLRGLPPITLVTEIDSETVIRKLTLTARAFTADLAQLVFSLVYLDVIRRLREVFLMPGYSLTSQRLEKAINYFEQHIDQHISIDDVAHHVSISTETLGRIFRFYYKTGPKNFLLSMRLTKAHELLRSGRCSVSEAGYMTGFNSPQYFSRAFKQAYGIAPVQCMNKHLLAP